MRVAVYYNLNKHVWSVKALEGPNRGRVIAHRDELSLSDVTFKVSEASRLKVVANKCRSVHAVAVGTLDAEVIRTNGPEISYNPYKGPTFYIRATGAPVLAVPHLYFGPKRLCCTGFGAI